MLGSKTKYDSDVQYRYIEGLLGGDVTGDTVENIFVDDYVMYIAPDEESLTTARKSGVMSTGTWGSYPSDWKAIGTMPNSGYITAMNYDEAHPWSIGVPSAASGGSVSTYASDYVYTGSGLRSVRLSDNYSGTSLGAWCVVAYNAPSYGDPDWTARLSFR